MKPDRAAAIVIGRNEGARLIACLRSLSPAFARVVYVDSGSSDGSVEAAGKFGAEVVALDMAHPFTAARARNAGMAALLAQDGPPPGFVQFIDGDCEMDSGWPATAIAALSSRPELAAVAGRLRERRPEASVYNRLCDREWITPVGEARACGGIAMFRTDAFRAAGGFRDGVIAGEEPELCLRLRRAGWRIWRLDAEMALHDAAMTRFGQWWRRARRAGHAFAEGAWLHGRGPERHYVRETLRALFWGAALPAAILLAAALVSPWALAVALAYPAQVARLAMREGAGRRMAWVAAGFSVLGKFAEAQGVLDFHLRRLLGRPRGLIEYK